MDEKHIFVQKLSKAHRSLAKACGHFLRHLSHFYDFSVRNKTFLVGGDPLSRGCFLSSNSFVNSILQRIHCATLYFRGMGVCPSFCPDFPTARGCFLSSKSFENSTLQRIHCATVYFRGMEVGPSFCPVFPTVRGFFQAVSLQIPDNTLTLI